MAETVLERQETRLLLGGEWRETAETLGVRSPYDGSLVAAVSLAGEAEIDEALDRAVEAFEVTRSMPAHRRAGILRDIARGLEENKEDFARTLSLEAGKPIRDARIEVERDVQTFAVAAEEAKRIAAEVVPMDWAPLGENRFGLLQRFPIGPILGITPFNFPLNLVGHKVAPAIASGNPILIKPASATPLSALKLAGLAVEAGLPQGALSVLPCSGRTIEKFVADDRVKMVTFTGSMAVGWRLKQLAWKKKVTLELGGNAGVILHEDADLDFAIGRILAGGFSFAGQSCISVQRIYVHEPIWDQVVGTLVSKVQALRLGDPLDEDTDLGPMIEEGAAVRAEEWVREAVDGGAELLTGGRRHGPMLEGTVLTRVQPQMKVCEREVFAPLVGLFPYRDFEDAVAAVNDSEYGLQAGVFTRDVRRIWHAYRHLEVGGVMVNDVSAFRIDHMPYGGVKESGFGREGLRYTIEEMTEPRLMVLNLR